MIGSIFYVGTKTQQKIYWTDFGVGLKDVSNSTLIPCTFKYNTLFRSQRVAWHEPAEYFDEQLHCKDVSSAR